MMSAQGSDIVIGSRVLVRTYGLTTLGVVVKMQGVGRTYPYIVACEDGYSYHLFLSELIPIPESATEDQIKALRNLYGYSNS